MAETQPTALQLWHAILTKNKLLTQDKWNECVGIHRSAGGKQPIAQILLDKKYLTPKGVEVVGKKVEELLARQSGGTPTKPNPTPASAKPASPGGGYVSASTTTAAAPAKVTKPATDDGSIPLADGVADGTEPWRPSDAEWYDETGAEGKEKKDTATLDSDVERIDLVGEDELTGLENRPSKIIRDDRPYIKPASKTTARGKSSTSPAPVAVEVTQEEIPSPVPPGQVDPEAMAMLTKAVELGASDLHLSSGTVPFMRLHGALKFFEREKLTPEEGQRMALGFMDHGQQQRFLKTHDLDFAYENEGLGRFRVNALEEFRGTDIIFRIIPNKVPRLEELGLPPVLERFTEWHQGLVLVTGSAGCGKSTTAAALINLVNEKRRDHIITVEDPIEFIHISKGCNVTQRQVPTHTGSFASALKAALREDPDVIMIGEMRDLETVSLAIRAAETGHLVIGTLQTKSAARTIDRVVDVFPADQQAQIRTMLSESLRGIISQQLIPRKDGKGRVVAIEVLHATTAVSNLIRDSKTFQLPSLMQTGRKIGQKLMDDSLHELVEAGLVTREEAAKAAENPKHFQEPAPIPVDPKKK